MFFNLPFRGMWRPPRPGQTRITDRRAEGAAAADAVAKEMSRGEEAQRLWALGDEDGLLKLCNERAMRIGDAAYISPTMLFTALKGYLRSQ